MLSPLTVLFAGLAWVALLFAVALYGERHGERLNRVWPLVYALSLAVYCTAWTFYGTVTQAARWGVWLPPTFIGTIVLFAFGGRFLVRLAQAVRDEHASSLADLIAARFGKDPRLAAAVTAVALFGMVPYVALQLKAVAMSYAVLTQGQVHEPPAWQDAALWVTVVMAVFAMVFGTRRAAITEHNRGLVLAIGFESLFKLAAMLAAGAFAVWGTFGGYAELAERAAALPPAHTDGAYLALIALGALAMFTLPHQFHVGFVELSESGHLRHARWLFPVYLLLIALPVLPLAWAGALVLGPGVPSDLYVLGLPLESGRGGLALFAFLGGLSAATGMVIMAALALSLMIANHWLAPRVLRGATVGASDLRPVVLAHRRLAIVLVLALAFVYSRAMGESDVLADIGALSFSALAQLAPAVVAAVYWPGLPANAVLWGIAAGSLTWVWTLLVPVAVQTGLLTPFDPGAAFAWLQPDAFLGLGGLDRLPRGMIASLALNVLAFAVAARAGGVRLPISEAPITVGALAELAGRFLAPAELQALLGNEVRTARAGPELVARVERAFASVIGASSARLLVGAARRVQRAPLETVAALVGETSQALRFNQQLLAAAFDNMSQGISVVDRDLNLVAWNQRYAELFGYPPDLLAIGTPIAALVRHNAARGLLGEGAVESLVERRLARMRQGTPYVSERRFDDGTVLEIRGNPMPGGGFVATFTDVTAFRRAESDLKRLAGTLEQRVVERTRELEQAKGEAERANRAKTRFLAAVSHDLLQPINAAHLFTHALNQALRHPQYREAVANIDGALGSAESLLAALLDISRLDAGGMNVALQRFRVDDWFQHLSAEFRVLAAERGLGLRCVPSRAWVESDPQLLRRVLQNFLSNAVRYTQQGRILLGCRRRGAELSIEVWDTGPGIAEADRQVIFEEFRRLDGGGQGLGLGLAIAERIAQLLGHRIALRSWPGRGTCFSIRVPRAQPEPMAVEAATRAPRTPRARVLVVDNDPAVLRGMQALLMGWNCEVQAARNGSEAQQHLSQAKPDLLLLDYHLDGNETGLRLRTRLGAAVAALPCIVITADHADAIRAECEDQGCHLLHKPLRPLALKSLMSHVLAARR